MIMPIVYTDMIFKQYYLWYFGAFNKSYFMATIRPLHLFKIKPTPNTYGLKLAITF